MTLFPTCRRRTQGHAGLTLVEVVVGLVMMASILVASLLAHRGHQRQLSRAKAKQTAVSIADEMLQKWSVSRSGIPVAGSGNIPGKTGWFWQTQLVGIASPTGTEVKVIRLRISEQTPVGTIRQHCQVEVVKS